MAHSLYHISSIVLGLNGNAGDNITTEEPFGTERVVEGEYVKHHMELFTPYVKPVSSVKNRVKEVFFLKSTMPPSKNATEIIIQEWKDENTLNETCLISSSNFTEDEVELYDYEEEEDEDNELDAENPKTVFSNSVDL